MIGRRGSSARLLALLLALLTLVASVHDAQAASRKRRPARKRAPHRAARIVRGPTYASALVMEAETGRILYAKDIHAPRAPASLAKMMLELLTFEALRRGDLNLEKRVAVPSDIRGVYGSRVRLKVGEIVTIRDLLYATAIASANDAATALAVQLAGSPEACVRLMNQRARELGMASTTYRNVHGLDRKNEPGNVTTAWDLSILARRLIEIPEALEISQTEYATVRGFQRIHTTNRLLGRCPGVDGLKTGYTGKAGFCLVSTAERGGMRLISVVLGASSNTRRFSESADLLDRVYNEWQRVQVVAKGQDLGQTMAVHEGRLGSVRLVAGDDVSVLLPRRGQSPEIRVAVATPPSTRAPIAKGWTLGRVQVLVGDSVAAECPAVAAGTVPRRNPVVTFFESLMR
ncbi:MAG: D-alanyl-D-alanine carboxypeptidase family protein [Candidatus Eisenbacteria bacterium]|nr:D-alanyl-D-alanine carboxypeptidase family protein [Candidatus Eisenbacteria bacterium]